MLSVVAGIGGGSLGHVSVSGDILVDGRERGEDYRLMTSLLPQVNVQDLPGFCKSNFLLAINVSLDLY